MFAISVDATNLAAYTCALIAIMNVYNNPALVKVLFVSLLFNLSFLVFFSLYILHVASRHGVLTLFPPPIVLLMALSGTHPLSYPLLSVCLVTAVSPPPHFVYAYTHCQYIQ